MIKRDAGFAALRLAPTVIVVVLAGCSRQAVERAPEPEASANTVDETPAQRGARMAWWEAARFGLFVHWGPVSLQGTEIGWSRGGERRGTGGSGEVPVETYDNLYRQFNPVAFDADEWARLARDAGMKYVVFTTKHHDGFANFDSALTDYKITSEASPFRRDIVRELAQACRRYGLRFGVYYSQPDWRHPDYRTSRHADYVRYFHGQVRELCTNYGRVSVVWFDGLGGTAADWQAESLTRMIRELQPGVIINNRAGLPGDYDTPEQTIGAFQNDRPWETCMTIANQWSYKPNDEVKSLKQCLQTLVRVAGGDGNFLFNVGPMPDGRIEPLQTDRLREMGDWLRHYGRSIYGTRGGPFRWNICGPAPCVSTRSEREIYLHVLEWEGDSLRLPPLPCRIVDSSVLTGGEVIVRQNADGVTVSVPAQYHQEIDTIIVLRVDRPTKNIPLLNMYPGMPATIEKTTASNVYKNEKNFDATHATDGHVNTRWATDAGVNTAWLEVDAGKQVAVSGVVICEALAGRVQEFEIEYFADGRWISVHRGTTLGDRAIVQFPPVQARQFRLNILKATEGPTIAELQLLTPDGP